MIAFAFVAICFDGAKTNLFVKSIDRKSVV